MNSRWLIVLVAASLALNAAVVAGFFFLRPRRHFGPKPLPGMKAHEMREMMSMREQFDPKMDTLRDELRTARGQLFRLAADSASPAQAESLLQAIGSIRIDMNRLAYEHLREVMAKLDPAQRDEFLRRLEQGPGRGHCGPGRRGHDCPRPDPEFDGE